MVAGLADLADRLAAGMGVARHEAGIPRALGMVAEQLPRGRVIAQRDVLVVGPDDRPGAGAGRG